MVAVGAGSLILAIVAGRFIFERFVPKGLRSWNDPESQMSGLEQGEAWAAMTWEPERTWLVMAGVLQWEDADCLEAFPQAGRRDALLFERLVELGIPREQAFFLRDEEASTENIYDSLQTVFRRAGPVDLLIFYYTGHGAQTRAGRTYFYPAEFADCETWGEPEGALFVDELFDAVDEGFAERPVLWLADCCFSGALAEMHTRSLEPLFHSALCSAPADVTSTGNWTFTAALLDAFSGSTRADGNGDGLLNLGEIADFVSQEVAYLEGQLATAKLGAFWSRPMTIVPARSEPLPGEGRRVLVLDEGEWVRASVLREEGERAFVRYANYGDEFEAWVPKRGLRDFEAVSYALGASIEARFRKEWRIATVLERKHGLHRVRFEDIAVERWLPPERMRLPLAQLDASE